MADVSPPGEYPLVIVGSGPGGLQTSYSLSRLGVQHAVISKDEAPGGMFRQFPIFDRLISWTKPHAPVDPASRKYLWYDWNSLVVDDDSDRVPLAEFMDGTSEFPSRSEMQRSLETFAERNKVAVRFNCRWERTRREGNRYVLETSDGDYVTPLVVFAVGMTEPWKPSDIPGVEEVPHYMELKPPKDYAGKSLYILGKATSAFEVADGLLPWAGSMVLSSPNSVKLSVTLRSLSGLRARYMQPMEDWAVGGRSVMLLDAATERFERTANGYRVHLKGTTRELPFASLDFDEAVIATGVSTPVGDLPELGVEMFSRGGRLPAQTSFWESASKETPGIYFAGSITQGTLGLRRSTGAGAVHGFRFNARLLAEHIASKHFEKKLERPTLAVDRVVPYLLEEATSAPELWNQFSYLGRVVTFGPQGIVDEGIQSLAHFVDAEGPDAVAVGIVSDDDRDLRAAVYIRRDQKVEEHILEGSEMLNFTTDEHRRELETLLKWAT